MPYVVAFFVAVVLALMGIAVDVVALRRGVAKRLAIWSLVLKGAVATAFVAYFVALRLGAFSGWGDLTTIATLIVAAPVLLGASIICDGLALRAVRAVGSGR